MTRVEQRKAYKQMIKDAPLMVQCSLCKEKDGKRFMHPHHVSGRSDDNLLRFVWLHPLCHEWVHHNVDKARDMRLIEYRYDVERRHHEQHDRLLRGDKAEIDGV